MTKQLFEEALADVKKVKQVAEDNAKRAILDAVTPRIHAFIDQVILREHGVPIDAMPGMHGAGAVGGPPEEDEEEIVTDDMVAPPGVSPAGEAVTAAAITPPDAEGKVTLDIDALCGGSEMGGTGPGAPVPPPMFGEPAPKPAVEDEYEINFESVDALKPVLSAAKKNAKPLPSGDVGRLINKIVEHIERFRKASQPVRATRAYGKQIAQMISRVEDMYDYVQEQVTDPAKKSTYGTTLENSFTVLNKLQESTTMSQKTRNGQMNEADLTLKLTGLPDEVEDQLDSVGVDLITGEEGEEDLEGGQGGEGGQDLDFGDMGGGQGGQGLEDEEAQMENRRLSDDTIVEIDENMLRREIARMRSLREETKPAAWGDGSGDASILDDFGGGKDTGDPVDQEIADLSPAKAARPLGEADEDLDEVQQDMDESQDQDQDDLDEADQDLDQAVHAPQDMAMEEGALDQVGDRRTRDDFGGSATSVPSKDKDTPAARHGEAVKRLGFEKKLQERAKVRAAALKKEAARARTARDARRLGAAKKEYAVVAKRFNESLARSKKYMQIAEAAKVAAKKLQEQRSNSAATRPAENKAAEMLRKKLAETNLVNAKLLLTNKLLQNEQLTSRQKAAVIRQLDEALTVREAKLVYQSLARTLAGSAKPMREGVDRQVLGSASRATKPASTQTLNEGYETERWAKLAGIVK